MDYLPLVFLNFFKVIIDHNTIEISNNNLQNLIFTRGVFFNRHLHLQPRTNTILSIKIFCAETSMLEDFYQKQKLKSTKPLKLHSEPHFDLFSRRKRSKSEGNPDRKLW